MDTYTCTDYDATGKPRRVSHPFFLAGTAGADGPGGLDAVSRTGTGTGATFYYYDGRGNQTVRDAPGTANDRTIVYSADDKAHEIRMGSGQRVRFWYGPDGQRYKREEAGKTTYYVGGVEVVVQSGVTTFKRYLGGIALQTVSDSGAISATQYLFHDHLGSLVRIANADGSVAESLDYTAFGDRRSYSNPNAAGTASVNTPRGFTGHEYVDGTGVIHMNGRIYDQELGRFLQADPVIQAPDNAQSWNAYTYVFNNPLAYTDPTGLFSIGKLFKAVAAAVVMYFTAGAASLWIYAGASAASIGTGLAIMAAGDFIAGAITTGTLKGGLYGAFGAALTGGILAMQLGPVSGVIAQGVSGGIMESIQGGSFGSGFVAAGLTASFMPQVGRIQNDIGRTLTGALVGGTISEATGGKFANGAMSGAIQGAMAKQANPEDPSHRDRSKDVNRRIASKTRNLVNDALQGAGKYSVGYTTQNEAADAWWETVSELNLRHEVGAGIFEFDGKFYLGRAISSGSRGVIYGAENFISSDKFTAFVHNHPGNGAIRLSGDGISYQSVGRKMVSVCTTNCSGDVRFAMSLKKDIYAFNSSGSAQFSYHEYMGALNSSQGNPVSVMSAITTRGP